MAKNITTLKIAQITKITLKTFWNNLLFGRYPVQWRLSFQASLPFLFQLHSPVSSKLEREKSLPSFILAVDFKVFDKLYQLAELEETQITCALRNLLQQLPTDADVLQAIDIFSFQVRPLIFQLVEKNKCLLLKIMNYRMNYPN